MKKYYANPKHDPANVQVDDNEDIGTNAAGTHPPLSGLTIKPNEEIVHTSVEDIVRELVGPEVPNVVEEVEPRAESKSQVKRKTVQRKARTSGTSKTRSYKSK